MKLFFRNYFALFILVLTFILLKVLSFFPDFVTQYYSHGFYPKWASFLRFVLGKIPFSVGDVMYFAVILIVIRWIWFLKKNWISYRKAHLRKGMNFLIVIFVAFHVSWGFNYQRKSLATELKIKTKYTQAELEDFTWELIEKTNRLHVQITKNDTITYANPYDIETIFLKSEKAYTELSKHFPLFAYSNLSVKKSLFSLPLSYMGFSGYLNPFTNEAQVNYLVPKYNVPTTTLHEMAHQLGIASESEANFIGYLASVSSDDVHFQYSGMSFALKYCLKNIERFETNRAEIFLETINRGVVANFIETEKYHEKYDSFFEVISKNWYDFFLKFNQQKDGLEGYNNFVGLMLNYQP